MGKAPAFSLYAADFYMDTNSWTTAQVGAYFRLLMYEWVNGPLPADNASRARIAGTDPRNMQKMWSAVIAKKFTTDDAGMYVNKRLEETRQKQKEYQEKQSVKGKKAAEKRWHEDVTVGITQAQPEDSSSSSSSSSIKEKKISKKNIFIKPDIADVEAYCAERNNGINAKVFIDHYESNGWRVGKNPMRDWKASVRTWEHNNGTRNSGGAGKVIEKTRGAKSDGADYPTDHEF